VASAQILLIACIQLRAKETEGEAQLARMSGWVLERFGEFGNGDGQMVILMEDATIGFLQSTYAAVFLPCLSYYNPTNCFYCALIAPEPSSSCKDD
jgi:hypothetical protein